MTTRGFKITKIVASSLLLLLMGLSAYIFWPGYSQKAETASRIECDVFTTLYDYINNEEAIFFSSVTLPQIDPIPRLLIAPSEFLIAGFKAETEFTEASVVKQDTSAFYHELFTKPSKNIQNCFNNQSHAFSFYSRGFKSLIIREDILDRTDDGFVTLIKNTNVAMSENQQLALVYVLNNCGSLCSSGSYYLLSKDGTSWKVSGISTKWVS